MHPVVRLLPSDEPNGQNQTNPGLEPKEPEGQNQRNGTVRTTDPTQPNEPKDPSISNTCVSRASAGGDRLSSEAERRDQCRRHPPSRNAAVDEQEGLRRTLDRSGRGWEAEMQEYLTPAAAERDRALLRGPEVPPWRGHPLGRPGPRHEQARPRQPGHQHCPAWSGSRPTLHRPEAPAQASRAISEPIQHQLPMKTADQRA